MNTIYIESLNIENRIKHIRNLIYDLENADDIIKIVNYIGEYTDGEFSSNSKKEIIEFYFKSVKSLRSKLGDFEEIFEAIKKGLIS